MKINGSLVFDASSASEIQNLRLQKVASNPTHVGAADQGRLIFNTTDGIFYFGSASAWVPIATGGNAAALQTEVDAIETSLGAIVDASGEFQVGAVTGPAFSGTEADLTELLQSLSDYANSNNELSELDDVTLTSLADNNLLQYNSATQKWENVVIGSASGVQAYDAGLDALAAKTSTGVMVQTGADTFVSRTLQAPAAGITITDADGVAGNPTFALANDLAALEGLSSTGMIARTADGAAAVRAITGPAAGITVTNGDGVAGNPTIALANDLAALEGLTTTGYVVRTGDGTATTRAMSVVSGDLVITGAADGVSTDTTFGLASVTQASSGDFVKITLDSKGRVTGNTAVTTADITALVDATYVNVSGDTMTGALNMGGFAITGLAAPAGANDAATKNYVDNAVVGLTWEAPVDSKVATLPAASGLTVGQRVYVEADNKIYTATSATSWDAGETVVEGAAFFDKSSETGYVGDGTGVVQFTGGGQLTAGIGLVKSGNTLDINLGAGITELPSDEVGLDVATGKAVQLTSTDASGQLTFVLDGGAASGMEQSASGLKISAGGVTNNMLANSTITLNGDTGTFTRALGETLVIEGDSVKGVSTDATVAGTISITIADASSSQKGVASFSDGDFSVTGGVVTIKAAGVDNSQLVNSTITVAGTSGSDAVALGETLTFSSTVSGLVSSTVATNGVALDVRLASTTATGVASFAAADFNVSAGGEVTVVAKDLDSLTDVAVTSAETGQMLVKTAGDFTNQHVYAHYDGVSDSGATAKTSHTFTHNLGQKFLNVTIVDDSDNVVIPQSIVFNSANQLTVTFNTAIKCHIIAMGVAGGKVVTVTD